MNKGTSFAAYDYVEDIDGWTYVVAGSCQSKDALAVTAMFSPPPKRIKCKNQSNGIAKPPYLKPRPSGPLDFEIDLEYISKHYSRKELLITEQQEIPEIIRKINYITNDHESDTYLFGSRRLGFQNNNSDWDLLVVGNSDPRVFLDKILSVCRKELRFYNTDEITKRIDRYVQSGAFSKELLNKLFPRTTRYFKWKGRDLAFFFATKEPLTLPSVKEIEAVKPRVVVGTIMDNGGASYCFPWLFRLRLVSGEIMEIFSVVWELGYLEECAGTKVIIRGVRQAKDGTYWLYKPDIFIENT